MAKKHTYKTVAVEKVEIEALVPHLTTGCIVGIDVAKTKFVAAVSTLAGEVVRLVRFEHPRQTPVFVEFVTALKARLEGKLTASMEPTGTYGDAVRLALYERGVSIVMVSPKRTHDSAAVFDGVQSLHDPKCADILAKLTSLGLGTVWHPPSPVQAAMRALVEQRTFEQGIIERAHGRIEALLARHWPELAAWIEPRRKTTLKVLAQYAGPRGLAAVPVDDVRRFLRETSRGRLAREVVDGLIASAQTTLGVPMVASEESLMRGMADRALEASVRAESIENDIRKAASGDVTFGHLATFAGAYTAAVIGTMCPPDRFPTSAKMEKACGLNLRVKSSGETDGRPRITKRGPGQVRQVLFLLALRLIGTDPVVRAWYMRRRGYSETKKRSAIVAVMRKITRAIGPVVRGEVFDSTKLFDTRKLDVEAAKKLLAEARPTKARVGDHVTPPHAPQPSASVA